MDHTINVLTEIDNDRGWTFTVSLGDDADALQYTVTLGWRDYDHWSHGRVAPQRVIQAAFRFLLERESPSEIMPAFDCAVIRRYFPDVDQELPKLL